MNLFAEFHNRTLVQAFLEMQTALSVGARLSLEPTGTDMPVVKDANGLPFIPGSSIKGVVRFQAERLLRTLEPNSACDPFGKPCVSTDDKDRFWRDAEQKASQTRESTDKLFSQKIWDQSCTACRLFGSPWFAGRVAFKDAFLHNGGDLPVVTQIRDGVGIDRDLGAARTGVKYDFEVVVPGTRFELEILTENLEDWELGFLLSMLRLWEEGGIAIGGKTTRGPGWGRLRDVTIRQVDEQNLLDYLRQGQTRAEEADRFLQAFEERVSRREASDA